MGLCNLGVVVFFVFSTVLVLGSTFVPYLPDNRMQDWASQEAERLARSPENQPLRRRQDPATRWKMRTDRPKVAQEGPPSPPTARRSALTSEHLIKGPKV